MPNDFFHALLGLSEDFGTVEVFSIIIKNVLRWMCGVTKLDKIRNERIRGGNHKDSPGKQVGVLWECDEKRGALRRKEGDGNESTREKEDRKA